MNMRSFAPVFLASLAAACSPSATPEVSLVRVAMPLALETAELRQLRVTQLGTVQELDLPAGGTVEARVLAGSPVDIAVTVLAVDLSATATTAELRAYTGAQQLVPAPGPNAVDIELVAADGRAGSVVPSFTISGVSYAFDTVVTVTDVETGHDFTGYVPRTAETFALPSGRLFRLTAVSPTDPGGTASIEISGSDFAAGTPLPLTPPSVELAPLRLVAGAATDINLALAGLPLPLTCAEGTGCPAGAAYEGTLHLTPAVERVYDFSCRYAGAPDLCVPLQVVVDSVAPELDLAASPPYLTTPPAPVALSIRASEPLDRATLAVTIGGAAACAAGPTWASDTEAQCTIDASLLGTDPTDVVVTAKDPTGNAGAATLRLRGLGTGATIAVTGLHTFPAEPDVTGTFYLGFDVVGLQTSCRGTVTIIIAGNAPPVLAATKLPAAPRLTGATASAPLPPSSLTVNIPAADVDLSLDPGGAPVAVTVWGEAQANAGLLPGTYAVTVDANAGACGTDTAVFDLALGPPPPRWITTNGVLVYAERTSGDASAGFAFPVATSPAFGWSSDNATVIDFVTVVGDYSGIVPRFQAPGRAVVAVTASPTDLTPESAAIVEVAPGPALAFLQDDGATKGWVVTADAATSEQIALDAAIGAPVRLLWEPVRDVLVAVGALGVEVLGTSPATILTGSKTAIADAAVVPDRSGGAGSVVVLLADATVARIHLADGAVTTPLALDTKPCTTGFPTRLAYGPISDDFVAYGSDCPQAFHFEPGGLRIRPLGLGAAFPEAAADPRSDYLVGLAGGAAFSVHTAGTGARDGRNFVDPVTGQTDLKVDAIAVDGTDGKPVVATLDSASGNTVVLKYLRGSPGSATYTAATFPAPTRVARMLLDATSQEVVAISTDPTPVVSVASLGYSQTPARLRVAPPALTAGNVRDAVLRGPQILYFSPRSASPGGVITIVGTGFAGQGADEVFVQGVRAETLSSSPTTVVARLPDSLASLPGTSTLVLGVRSHARMVQTPPSLALVKEPAILELTPVSYNVCASASCPTAPDSATLVCTDDGYELASYPAAGFFDSYTNSLLAEPMSQPTLRDGTRVVGWFDDAPNATLLGRYWVEYQPEDNLARRIPMDQGTTFAAAGDLAVDPTGRLLALATTGDPGAAGGPAVRLSWAPSYTEAGGPAALPSASASLAFTRDGRTLVAMGTAPAGMDSTQLWLAALDVSGDLAPGVAPPSVPVAIDASCPIAAAYPPYLLPFAGPTSQSLGVVFESASTRAGRSIVLGTVTPGAVTVGAAVAAGLVLSCTETTFGSSGLTSAAVSGSGRLIAVGGYDQLVVLSPVSPRAAAPSMGLVYTPDSVAIGPEQAGYTAPLLVSFSSPQYEIDTYYTR